MREGAHARVEFFLAVDVAENTQIYD